MHKLLELIKIDFVINIRRMLRPGCLQARRQVYKMAAWRKTLSSTEEVGMCSSCFCSTKYTCLKCEDKLNDDAECSNKEKP